MTTQDFAPDATPGPVVSATDPGADGAGRLWVDISSPSSPALKIRNATNSGWVAAAVAAVTLGGTPSNSAPGDVAATGTASTASHSDHVHGREAAAAAVWQGTWASGTTYGVSAIVVGSDNHVYISKAAGNIGHDPTSDAGVHWQALAA